MVVVVVVRWRGSVRGREHVGPYMENQTTKIFTCTSQYVNISWTGGLLEELSAVLADDVKFEDARYGLHLTMLQSLYPQ